MGAQADIPLIEAGRDEGALVWLVDGAELPFESAPEHRRPWLEESAEWGAPGGSLGAGTASDEGGEALLWL